MEIEFEMIQVIQYNKNKKKLKKKKREGRFLTKINEDKKRKHTSKTRLNIHQVVLWRHENRRKYLPKMRTLKFHYYI